MFYIGIDPGKKGAIAIIRPKPMVYQVIPYTDDKLKEICEIYSGSCKVAVENVHAMPNQGTVSMFNFGKSFGFILGMLKAFEIPYQLVSPQKWKAEYGVTSDKNTSIAVCKEIFPNANLYPTKRSRKESPDMAEALLIAEWGRKHMKGET